MDKYSVLKELGFDNFRAGQEEVIDAILSGRDSLSVMPTGAGKSLCYQLPALLLAERVGNEGCASLTIVISPLISLMKDQVGSLSNAGVAAAFLNSSQSYNEYLETTRRARAGEYKLLYIAPERINHGGIQALINDVPIAMIVIDEAHCISEWGHDFRPAYLEIKNFVANLPSRPVIAAFTATATEKVRRDIIQLLKLRNPFVQVLSFDRSNLYFEVRNIAQRYKMSAVFHELTKRKGKSGIIYCATRKAVEEVSEALQARGFSVTRYHGGLSDDERTKNQDDFIYDRVKIAVATNAFGLGIDKSDVSFVIHYQIPKNLESYYQEAGRAGRNGGAADCILFYTLGDIRTNKFLINNSQDENGMKNSVQIAHNMELLNSMIDYATSGGCLRAQLLNYFGEESPERCGNCSACKTPVSDIQFSELDVSIDAQKIISCVYRIEERGKHFGKTTIAEILRGSASKKIQSNNLNTLSTYGIMRGASEEHILAVFDLLVKENYLSVESGKYPTASLAARWREAAIEKKQILMKVRV
jgi:ATP-dependent DNA helicase RecQ